MLSTAAEQAKQTLLSALSRFDRGELSGVLNVSLRTLDRWERGPIPNPGLIFHALRDVLSSAPDNAVQQPADFSFIDLFAGIGGTRMGFEAAGGECVYTSEYDKYCAQTYRANFLPDHPLVGDIRTVDPQTIPDHDVLIAGFPCQPFSIAGVSKKNSLGMAHGFECQTQGTLFFDICRIIAAKRPVAFMLENVRNLKSHDKGKTFSIILDSLMDLGYQIEHRVIDARAWVPQHRERIFIVGFREPTAFKMDMVKIPGHTPPTLDAILHRENSQEKRDGTYVLKQGGAVNPKYTLTAHLWRYLRDYAAKHKAAGNGFGYSLFKRHGVARTLSARYYKDGSEVLISRGKSKIPRRLTPRECARLMGYPDTFNIPVSDTQAYKQFGNSVVVPVVEAVARAMAPHVVAIKEQETQPQLSMVI